MIEGGVPRGTPPFLVKGGVMPEPDAQADVSGERAREGAQPGNAPLARIVCSGMVLGAMLTIGLIISSVVRLPSIRSGSRGVLVSISAGIGIATVYGMIGWFGIRLRGFRDPRILRQGVRFGLTAGIVFAVSMLGEYLIPHGEHENVILAIATFGLFFVLLLAAGLFATLESNRLASGPLAAVWAALIASQLWFLLLLAIYHAFVGTAQEARFLEVDQVIADFQRHGARDLRTFIFEDYMGGGFFHSLLGPLLAVPLGLLGGLVARSIQIAKSRCFLR